MAGFLGFGNFTKAGKGIKKGEPQKKRFFVFLELFKRKFGKLIKLNLLFLLFSIPIITIGPAFAAMTKITRYYIEEKPVFLFTDFVEAFKSNFKQGFVLGLINVIFGFACYTSFLYYYVNAIGNKLLYIPTVFILIVAILLLTMSFYTFLLIVTLDLKIIQVLKNSLMLVFLGAKSNFFTIIFTVLVLLSSLSFFPITLLIPIFIAFSAISLIANFNSFQHVYRYLIKPYFDQSGLDNPYEPKNDDDAIFEDATK